MTPNEKARELYDEFYEQAMHALSIEIRKHVAKQCALIAVNKMIAFVKQAFSHIHIELATPSIKYLEEVKQEIEKL